MAPGYARVGGEFPCNLVLFIVSDVRLSNCRCYYIAFSVVVIWFDFVMVVVSLTSQRQQRVTLEYLVCFLTHMFSYSSIHALTNSPCNLNVKIFPVKKGGREQLPVYSHEILSCRGENSLKVSVVTVIAKCPRHHHHGILMKRKYSDINKR